MRVELTEVIWLEEQALTFAELADLSGLPHSVLEELVQAGAITPIHPDADHDIDGPDAGDRNVSGADREARFSAAALAAARHARQLCEDFELDAPALLLVLGLCDRVSELTARLRELQAKLPRRVR